MNLKTLPALLVLLTLTSCAPPERPTESTTTQPTANPDNQVVLTTLDDAKVVINEVHNDPVTSVTISVLTPNNPTKLIDKFDAYLYNVCRVRPTEGD